MRELNRLREQVGVWQTIGRALSDAHELAELGDEALREYTARFDGVHLDSFSVSDAEFAAAEAALTPVQRAARWVVAGGGQARPMEPDTLLDVDEGVR